MSWFDQNCGWDAEREVLSCEKSPEQKSIEREIDVLRRKVLALGGSFVCVVALPEEGGGAFTFEKCGYVDAKMAKASLIYLMPRIAEKLDKATERKEGKG